MNVESSGAPPRRAFGLATATFVVVSSMVGTGVLTTSGYTVLSTQSNALMLLLWVVGGVVAVCGALCVAELAAALPHTGGDYVYLQAAYGPLPAFLSGWVSFFIGFGGPIALSASAAAAYLIAPWHLSGDRQRITELGIASAVILAFTVVHAAGRRHSIIAQAGTTVVKLGILSVLAAAGIAAGWGRGANLDDLAATPGTIEGLGAIGVSLLYISYAFTGWNAAGYVAGEIDQPKRLPRAILLGTGLVTALYLALNLFYALALPASEVHALVFVPGMPPDFDAVKPIAEIAAGRLFGPGVRSALSIAVGLTMLASLSAFVLTGPRVMQAMAATGHFPAFAGRTNAGDVPATATWIQAAWSLLLLWTGTFEQILNYSSVGLAMFSMLTVSAVIVLRWRRPDLPRPFRATAYPLTPILFLAPTAALTIAAFLKKPVESLIALGVILLGVPVFLAWSVRRAGRPTPPVTRA